MKWRNMKEYGGILKMESHATTSRDTKRPWAVTDLVTPQIVIPGLIASVVIFAWLNGML
jgi:hypothetical protein